MRAWALAIAVLVLLLPGVMLLPAWSLGGLGANEDDILYYYPSRVFFRETIRAGQWPWLNPWNGLDRPFAADPQSALWYPFTWLFVALPPSWAYPACLWAHYSLALWGMYRLLRAGRLGRSAALFGGLLFAFCGFMLAHRAHFTMQHAAAWAPWVLWRWQRYVEGSTGEGSAARLAAVCAVTAAQCFAGHVQMAAITLLGVLVFLLARGGAAAASPAESRPSRMTMFVRVAVAGVSVVGLFAVQWMPTLAYVRECTRTERTYWDFTENSWHPTSALGWALPLFFGQRTPNLFDQTYWGPSHQCEQFSYAGLAPLLLAAIGLRAGWRTDQRRRPWVALLVFGLALALGKFGPICPLLYWVPGSSLFRVPARALLLFNLAVAALAAATVHDLAARPTPQRARLRAALAGWTTAPLLKALALIAAPLLAVLVALPFLPAETRAAAWTALRPTNPAIWLPATVAAATFGVLALVARYWKQRVWLGVLTLLAGVDLGLMGWSIDVPRDVAGPAELARPAARPWLGLVGQSDARLWVVTDTSGVYTRPLEKCAANTNLLVPLHSLTDYGPLHPKAYYQRFTFTPWGTTPRATELLHDPAWPPRFNVGWVLLCDPALPEPAECELVDAPRADWRLYRPLAEPRMAYFEDPTQSGAIHYQEVSPTAFVTRIDTWPARRPLPTRGSETEPAPVRVVVARLKLPGWRATLAGRPIRVESTNDGLLAAAAPAGEAVEIHWRYVPPGWREGAAISALSVLALLLLTGTGRVAPGAARRRRGRRQTGAGGAAP